MDRRLKRSEAVGEAKFQTPARPGRGITAKAASVKEGWHPRGTVLGPLKRLSRKSD